jgi:hypothetical protein
MNTKMIGALLGTLAIGGMNVAYAGEAPAEKTEKPAKGKKKGEGKGEEKGKGGEKSCGGDGKSCGGAKGEKK